MIINSNGEIDKEKYIALIRDYYKKPEVLDGDNIKEQYFRFRAYKNDLIFSTSYNTLLKFNTGSIVNKKLEMKYVNIFSYNDIYEYGREISNKLILLFNIKAKANKDGVPFKEFKDNDKKAMIQEINSRYWFLENNDKKLNAVFDKAKECKNLFELSNSLAFYGLIINRPGTPPTITGQYKPTISSGMKDDSDYYIKLKYNILGIKAKLNENNKLVIYSPTGNGYSKIKKEKFYWQISKNLIE